MKCGFRQTWVTLRSMFSLTLQMFIESSTMVAIGGITMDRLWFMTYQGLTIEGGKGGHIIYHPNELLLICYWITINNSTRTKSLYQVWGSERILGWLHTQTLEQSLTPLSVIYPISHPKRHYHIQIGTDKLVDDIHGIKFMYIYVSNIIKFYKINQLLLYLLISLH